jgi:hypothetical protein
MRSRKPDVRGVKRFEGVKCDTLEQRIQQDIGCRRAQEGAFPNCDELDWDLFNPCHVLTVLTPLRLTIPVKHPNLLAAPYRTIRNSWIGCLDGILHPALLTVSFVTGIWE